MTSMIRSKQISKSKVSRRRSVSPDNQWNRMQQPIRVELATNVNEEVKRKGYAKDEAPEAHPSIVIPKSGIDLGTSSEIKLPASTFLDILKQLEQSKHGGYAPPQDAIVNSITMDGKAMESSCFVKFHFEITTLADSWTSVKLLADSLCLKNIVVEVLGGETLGIDANPPPPSNPSTTEPSSSQPAPVPAPVPEDEGEVMGYVGVHEGYYCLFSSIAAQFIVNLEAELPYVTARNKFAIPYAVSAKLSWSVPRGADRKEIDIKVEPSLSNESVERTDTSTTVKCQVCPSKFVNVQWTEKENEKVSKPVEQAKVETVVRAEQFSVASVGDGMVIMKTAYDFTFVSGSRAAFDFDVDHDYKVMSVEGAAVRRWEVTGVEDLIPDVNTKVQLKDTSRKRLTVYLNYGVENTYHLDITGEKEMRLASSSTIANAVIPIIHCLSVEKEKGCLGIQARTNVEVRENQVRGVARIDTTELPYNANVVESSRPVLYAYKFARNDYLVELTVEKHDDVGVLVAAVDAAYLTVVWAGIPGKTRPNSDSINTHVADATTLNTPPSMGRCMGCLKMRIRNSQRQYIRVTLPPTAEVWSANCAGRTVKPARDRSDNRVMIPLEKDRMPFDVQVDFAWEFYSQDLDVPTGVIPRSKEFMFNFKLPQVDLPVNRLFLAVYSPSEYWYGDAYGGIDAVDSFMDFPFNEYGDEPVATRARRFPAQQQQQMMMPQMQMNARMNDEEQEEEQERAVPREAGVLPVNVSIPRVGHLKRFQRLLVVNDVITVEMPCRLDGKKKGGCLLM